MESSAAENRYNAPLYYSAEVSRLACISVPRVHRWLEGYNYSYESRLVSQPPVVQIKRERIARSSYASFNDLVDLLFIKHFLDYGLSLQKLRLALAEAEQILGTSHFVHQKFFTDGKNICLKVREKGDAILQLLSGGQWVIKEFIEQLAYQIDFDDATKYARRWFPPEGNRLVVLDPLISFGKPTIWKKGITTEHVFSLYIAEGKKEGPVCDWMDLEPREVLAAAKFETRLSA
jgi:uncharacterized protein (DUF433 family)/DNA-binding transcriptional MerR regulator